ncbi:hypothetical protein QYE76_048546 [Lolium multiflorum]|uniref:Uncharacterized protein n=1 Tax=Lolium multiflorum TaxID=4521 RepID=A0AAD8SL91_LOLMU|nr:hypothetical protein QYE76_048546 [Lolium multiflorum]
MHTELSVPNVDGERKTEAQVISEVLAKKTRKPMFLQNVGVEHKPYTSCVSTLSAQLDREKTGSTDLWDILNTQRHEMDELTSQIEESEEKHCELEQNLQALTRLFDQQRRPCFGRRLRRQPLPVLCHLRSTANAQLTDPDLALPARLPGHRRQDLMVAAAMEGSRGGRSWRWQKQAFTTLLHPTFVAVAAVPPPRLPAQQKTFDLLLYGSHINSNLQILHLLFPLQPARFHDTTDGIRSIENKKNSYRKNEQQAKI